MNLPLIGKFEKFAINKATDHKQACNVQIILQLNKTSKYQDLFVYFPASAVFLLFCDWQDVSQQFEAFLKLATYV